MARFVRACFFLMILILGCFVGLNVRTVKADSRTIYVDVKNQTGVEDGSLEHPFDTIQEGIDNATDGDTVFVFNGTYYLNQSIRLNKSIRLSGEDKYLTIIDGNRTDENPDLWFDGIYATVCNVTIERFIIQKADIGIHLVNSNFSIVRDNVIATDLFYDDGANYYTSRGVLLEHSCNNAIYNNNLTDNGYGVWLDYSSNCNNITDNLISSKANETDPARYWDGILIYNSNYNNAINNTIGKLWDCGFGLYQACNNTVQDNIITDIYGRTDPQQFGYGIVLCFSSHYNVVTNNSIFNSDPWGISLEYNSNGNTLVFNNLVNNSIGIFLNNSGSNNIYHNNFVNNTSHVSSVNSNNVWNSSYPSGGNYWTGCNWNDTRKGPNQDKPGWDGINDTGYQIDQNDIDHYPTMNTWPLNQLKVETWAIGDGKIETAGVWVNETEPHQNSTAYYLLKPATYSITVEAYFTRQDPRDPTKYYDYIFDHWEDNTKQNPRTITLNTNKTIIAYYKVRIWYIEKTTPK